MANAVPILEGTDASGGYLVRDTIGATLQNQILRLQATGAVNFQRVGGKRQRYTIYAGRPTAAFVAEGAAKPVTGAEFTELVVNVKKIATIVMYTEEMLEDAQDDPTVFVNADVRGAFADLIDAHVIGEAAGANIATSFDNALRSTTSTVELANTGGDRLSLAISAAMGKIEEAGYNPTDVILPTDVRQAIRDARAAVETTMPVFGNGRDPFYGLTDRYSSNISKYASAAAAGKAKGFVVDRAHLVGAMRKDIVVRQSDQATVDVSGTLHHLFQQNKTAMLWEMRVGFNIHDINNTVVAILDAA